MQSGKLTVILADNLLDADAISVALQSATRCSSGLSLLLQSNRVTMVPPMLFQGVSSVQTCFQDTVLCITPSIDLTVDLSANPITRIDRRALTGLAHLKSATILLNDLTGGSVDTPTAFNYAGVVWDDDATLSISFSNSSGVPMTVVNSLTRPTNGPMSVIVDLSSNSYTSIAAGICTETCPTGLNLSHNAISSISPQAFNYTFTLETLDLSNNALTLLSLAATNNLPTLSNFRLAQNRVYALPLTNNHIATPSDAVGNPLQCGQYGASAANCSCAAGYVLTPSFCGYVRCTLATLTDGCPPRTSFNSTDCSNAPESVCVSRAPPGQFFENGAFRPVSVCRVEFADVGQAYQVTAPTTTSDRVCSLCSKCPGDYSTTPCTATTDSKCTQTARLAVGNIVAIVLAVIMLGVAAAVGATYGRMQMRHRHHTQNELELTERLLGDVTEEKDRATEEITVMEQAWLITETDLTVGGVIGEGAFGRVYQGVWG